jgi:hypothetical protein
MIKISTAEYWLENPGEEIFGDPDEWKWTAERSESKAEGELLDYIEFKRSSLVEGGRKLLEPYMDGIVFHLSKDGELAVSDTSYIELAVHLMNFWTCQVIVGLYPEYHFAKAKTAHLLSVSDPRIALHTR